MSETNKRGPNLDTPEADTKDSGHTRLRGNELDPKLRQSGTEEGEPVQTMPYAGRGEPICREDRVGGAGSELAWSSGGGEKPRRHMPDEDVEDPVLAKACRSSIGPKCKRSRAGVMGPESAMP